MDLFRIDVWFLVFIASLHSSSRHLVLANSQVPCFFIFGDSLSDCGNNNGLETIAKANYPPYGIDHKYRTTGRFTNGLTTVDIIAKFLGFKDLIPPFATAQGYEILKGVNYASGAGGIRDETSKELGERISMNKQLENHQKTITRVNSFLGNKTMSDMYLNKCLYSVSIGSNDYINNYLRPEMYPTSINHAPPEYATILIEQFSKQLRKLYDCGARKVAVFGLGLVGCMPAQFALHPREGSNCTESINKDVRFFDTRLKILVDVLNKDFRDAHFTYINVTEISSAALSKSGIEFTNVPCCPVSNKTGQCLPNKTPCKDRSKYAFWDAFHPTEISNLFIAKRAYNAATALDVHPIDINRLVQL